jgi:acyl-CoA thioester hydrolase
MDLLEVRVRYAETDQMGVAHHCSYLVWFEAGRTEFIRTRGRSYAQIEADGWLLVVVEARCQYLRPARYDDVLVVRTRLGTIGPATFAFEYEVVRKDDGEVLARGTTRHAAVDRTGHPRRIPGEIRHLLGIPNVPAAGRPDRPPGRRGESTGELEPRGRPDVGDGAG